MQSRYVGLGPAAELVAALDALKAAGRRDQQQAARAARAEAEARNRDQADRFALVEHAMRGVLEAAGFHRHARGPWRRRRPSPMNDTAPAVPRETAAGVPVTLRGRDFTIPVSYDETKAVIRQARGGDKAALRQLQTWLGGPHAPGLIEWLNGDLESLALETAASRACPASPTRRAATLAQARRLAAELAGPDPSPIERLLASRIAACWLDVHDWDFRHDALVARHRRDQGPAPTDRQHAHLCRMRSASHRRYLAAIKALASVRKLGPAVQVNAAVQINHAPASEPAARCP